MYSFVLQVKSIQFCFDLYSSLILDTLVLAKSGACWQTGFFMMMIFYFYLFIVYSTSAEGVYDNWSHSLFKVVMRCVWKRKEKKSQTSKQNLQQL